MRSKDEEDNKNNTDGDFWIDEKKTVRLRLAKKAMKKIESFFWRKSVSLAKMKAYTAQHDYHY